MGLDLALGLIVLLAAIRGWLKGFVLQAIRLAGLVACVYAADPVRDLAKPYVLPNLPSIRPEAGGPPDLVGRLRRSATSCSSGWRPWSSNSHAVRRSGWRSRIATTSSPGLCSGAAKGCWWRFSWSRDWTNMRRDRIQGIAWAEEQAKTSKVLKWNARYEPAAKIWASPPVRVS